jgi:AbiU2
MDRQDLFKLIDNFHICEADWNLYQQLFMNGPPRANTLNQLSGPFFAAIHRCLIEITFVRIFKLTDPWESGHGKNRRKNLTLDALREENKQRYGIEERYNAIMELEAVKKIRLYRNKIFAHADLATAQAPDKSTVLGAVIHNDVSMALDYIRSFLYEYCNEVGLPTPLPHPVPDVDELLAKFSYGDFPDDAVRH